MAPDGVHRVLTTRAGPAALAALTLAVGLAAEASAFAWGDTRHWLPDLAVGLVLASCAGLTWRRDRGVAVLLALTAVTWFAGNFFPGLVFWHRGPMVHLLVTYPRARPVTRLERVAVAGGYVAALVPDVWASEGATLVLAAALVGVALARGQERALVATWLFAGPMGAGAVARLADPSAGMVDGTLLLYEAGLSAAAVVLAAGIRPAKPAAVTDLVVDLGEVPSNAVRDALAHALGDPTLEIGYWSSSSAGYVEEAGRRIALPRPGSDRSATMVSHDSEPFAVLVHDATLLAEESLTDAVSAATRLAAEHARLQDEVRQRLLELEDSRRRLLSAGDAERAALGDRLHRGPEQRLRDLAHLLASVPEPRPEPLVRAENHVRQALEELGDLTSGLQPRDLALGLVPALTELARRAPLPVHLSATGGAGAQDAELAAYFTCAEALSNAVKHSRATHLDITIELDDARLLVVAEDDGIGGADRDHWRGLVGLADRWATLGGHLSVTSPARGGTRLVAELSLGHQAGDDRRQPILRQVVAP